MSGGSKWLGYVALVLGVGAGLLLALLLVFHRDVHATRGEEIMYDDFGFVVESSRSASGVAVVELESPPSSSERWEFVRLVVHNHARRVEFELDKPIPRIEDSEDHVYEVDARGTELLRVAEHAPPRPRAIQAGESWASDLVFRVSKRATGLRLRIGWPEPIPGIDRFVSGDRTITLDP